MAIEILKPSKQKIALFIILFALGLGFSIGPYNYYAPGTPGHETTIGFYGVNIGDSDHIVAALLSYSGFFLVLISVIFFIIFAYNKMRSK